MEHENRGLISTFAHGVLDYFVGFALILAPNLLGFSDVGGAAEAVPRTLGFAILGMALLTDYELGVWKTIPFSVHKTIDFFAGIFLALSPFIFRFNWMDNNIWLPHVIVGAAIVIIGLFSATRPHERLRHAHTH